MRYVFILLLAYYIDLDRRRRVEFASASYGFSKIFFYACIVWKKHERTYFPCTLLIAMP